MDHRNSHAVYCLMLVPLNQDTNYSGLFRAANDAVCWLGREVPVVGGGVRWVVYVCTCIGSRMRICISEQPLSVQINARLFALFLWCSVNGTGECSRYT